MRATVSKPRRCSWCGDDAVCQLRSVLDLDDMKLIGFSGELRSPWQAYCLACAVKFTRHWKKNGVKWTKRALRRKP